MALSPIWKGVHGNPEGVHGNPRGVHMYHDSIIITNLLNPPLPEDLIKEFNNY